VRAEVVGDADAIERLPRVDSVVVGADAVTPGNVVNKAGTRALATAARAAGVPCIVLAGELKFLGAEVPVVPPFERTPLSLAGAVAWGGRLLGPPEASAAARAQRLDPGLSALLATLRAGDETPA
jgi:hypothetical protein